VAEIGAETGPIRENAAERRLLVVGVDSGRVGKALTGSARRAGGPTTGTALREGIEDMLTEATGEMTTDLTSKRGYVRSSTK
jgi:hypothetical protein